MDTVSHNGVAFAKMDRYLKANEASTGSSQVNSMSTPGFRVPVMSVPSPLATNVIFSLSAPIFTTSPIADKSLVIRCHSTALSFIEAVYTCSGTPKWSPCNVICGIVKSQTRSDSEFSTTKFTFSPFSSAWMVNTLFSPMNLPTFTRFSTDTAICIGLSQRKSAKALSRSSSDTSVTFEASMASKVSPQSALTSNTTSLHRSLTASATFFNSCPWSKRPSNMADTWETAN
mmetsp:Transcript_27426/g.66128  ORF Transcript_27426/g.66128 Transcript_27426/m.66128 type:complete len:230 (-) Transcript_27426:52-741(-)